MYGDLDVPKDLNGIYLAIAGELTDKEGVQKTFPLTGGDAERCFLQAFQQLVTWGNAHGVDTQRILRQMQPSTA